MEAKELRKGNLVNSTSGIVVIDKFVYDEIRAYVNPFKTGERLMGFIISTLELIPITEEWLIKFGFVKDGILYEKGKFAIKVWKVGSDIEWVIFWGDKVILYKGKYYVHQLQNLYFALTGEELSFKEAKLK